MENIVDVTFNFELLREAVKKSIDKYNKAYDIVVELKTVWKVSDNLSEIDKTDAYFKEFYKGLINDDGEAYKVAYDLARKDIKNLVVAAIGDLKVATKNMETSIDLLTRLMKARVDYIESTHTQDELYGNYKLREERNSLNKEVKQYQKIKQVNIERVEEVGLSSFGLEIEGEPGMN